MLSVIVLVVTLRINGDAYGYTSGCKPQFPCLILLWFYLCCEEQTDTLFHYAKCTRAVHNVHIFEGTVWSLKEQSAQSLCTLCSFLRIVEPVYRKHFAEHDQTGFLNVLRHFFSQLLCFACLSVRTM